MAPSAVPATPLDLRNHPAYLNPHTRMCAILTGARRVWAEHGEGVVRAAYRALGQQTGRYMVDESLIARGGDAEQWGLLSDAIAATCGMPRRDRLRSPAGTYVRRMADCPQYVEPLRLMQAPARVCELPMEWDNGCLDVINPTLQVTIPSCAYRGDGPCIYALAPRGQPLPPLENPVPALEEADAVARRPRVTDHPRWTNPFVGVITLVTALVHTFGDEGRQVVAGSLFALGRRSGRYLLAHGLVSRDLAPLAWGRTVAGLMALAGYEGVAVLSGPAGSCGLRLDRQPYLEVYQHLGAPHDICDLLMAWDRGCLARVNPGLRLVELTCAWRDDPTCSWSIEPFPTPERR